MKQLSLFTLVFTFIFALAFTFSSCGNSNTNDIPNTGNTNGITDNTTPHVHEYQTSVTAPTCTDKGYTTHTCACGHSYIANEINALGHDYESVVTMPTETTNGYTTYTCSCGDSYIGDYTNPLSPSSGLDIVCPLQVHPPLPHFMALENKLFKWHAILQVQS